MRIFVSGPCTDLPGKNYAAFNAEAKRLRAIGYHVENPAENSRQNSWLDYMRVSIAQMVTCDAVAMLPGWQDSDGAKIERDLALKLGLPVKMADEYQAPRPNPSCWVCSGTGEYVGDPCCMCMEPRL